MGCCEEGGCCAPGLENGPALDLADLVAGGVTDERALILGQRTRAVGEALEELLELRLPQLEGVEFVFGRDRHGDGIRDCLGGPGWCSGAMKRKYSPWTLLKRGLEPLMLELHAAAPWRVCDRASLEEWIRSQTWEEMWWGDETCRSLCSEPPSLPQFPVCLHEASLEADPVSDAWQLRMAQQVMHRLLFALDLPRMSAGWRREFPLTGQWSADAKMVLIDGWRSNAPLVWARRFGDDYLGEAED